MMMISPLEKSVNSATAYIKLREARFSAGNILALMQDAPFKAQRIRRRNMEPASTIVPSHVSPARTKKYTDHIKSVNSIEKNDISRDLLQKIIRQLLQFFERIVTFNSTILVVNQMHSITDSIFKAKNYMGLHLIHVIHQEGNPS